jgi:hypothetical protein
VFPADITRVHRIFILGASILEEGIAHLLKFSTDLQVSGAKYTNDRMFLEDIIQAQPDVILLNESGTLNPAHIVDILFSVPPLAGRRVIIVRLTNNMIDVYDFPYKGNLKKLHKRRQYIVTKQDDLLIHCVKAGIN